MSKLISDPFRLTAAEIQRLIIPGTKCFPEMETARLHLDQLCAASQTQVLLAQTQSHMQGIAQIPQTGYTHYRFFIRDGDRTHYETPYFSKRANLAAAAIRLFLGETQLKDLVQDYVWDICEETNWVLPAHERVQIDLFSAETAFVLAEVLTLLDDMLDAEIRTRVRSEIEQRVFEPYLRFCQLQWWYQGHNNWNGVCNSSIAATFLLLEPELGRVARAIELALIGLRTFLDTAFEKDGSSTEGVGYWHYGLINFVALSEMLWARTNGAVDLLGSDHLRKIAGYPAKLLLSGSQFATFSDCDEELVFNPGVVARLAERTGEGSLLGLVSRLPEPDWAGRDWRLTMMLRNILWWDGKPHQPTPVADVYLPSGGVARLTARTTSGASVVLAIKAGHNDENHNQNDVGSFILHVDGETLLTDPGRGLYTRQYFGPERYENVFANSYGHSVPRIGGQMQKEGRAFCGELFAPRVVAEGALKLAEVEFAHAYPLVNLCGLRRQITLAGPGIVQLQDTICFAANPMQVEEAFVTWYAVETNGATAVIHGQRHDLRLTIESPTGVCFAVEELKEQCQANAKPGILKRITIALPAAMEIRVRVQMEIN